MFKYRLGHDHQVFLDRYKGSTATIVGSGPTTFNYEDLALLEPPIIFVNDSVVMEKYVTQESHFVSWHTEMFKKKAENCKSYFWGRDCPHGTNYVLITTESLDAMKLLDVADKLLDREHAVKNKFLYMHCLSPSIGVHLAHLFGCKAVQFVGCHPSDRPFHDPRINGKPFTGTQFVHRLKKWTELFGFDFNEARTSCNTTQPA